MKVVNKKAYYDYFVTDDFISGVILFGSEVKSMRNNDFNFSDSHIIIKNNELFIKNMRIAPYKDSTYLNHDEMRDKKLLLKKKEVNKIIKCLDQKGTAIIPLEIFTMKNKFKIKIGVCIGKKKWDKRESIKKKDIERENQRKF